MFSKGSRDLIDVGGDGIAGHYSKMIGKFRPAMPQAIVIADAWWWFLSWPLGPTIYQISPHITLAGVIAVGLGLWSARVGWDILLGIGFGFRWLRLEWQRLHWVRLNDQDFRVIYWRGDGSTRIDTSTRDQRLHEELAFRRHRNQSMGSHAVLVLCLLVGFFYLPVAMGYFYDFVGPASAAWYTDWHANEVVAWLWTVPLMLPAIASLGWDLFEQFVYACRAKFIPGAKVRDPVQTLQTIDAVREEMAYGGGSFVDPSDAAQEMSR